jgi:hypothetical protein
MAQDVKDSFTVQELYDLAKATMFEKPTSKDYDNYIIPWLNVLLQENFNLNNHLRLKHDEDVLEDCPWMESMDDEVPYEVEMCREILPYGLAANFFIDDDLSKYDILHRYYENMQSKYSWGVEEKIEDTYGGMD